MNYWLFKTEPQTYSIDDFWAEKKRTTCWDGVRNYQARNMLRDEIQVGDRVLLYHSSCKPTGIVGIGTVVRAGYPDYTAFDPEHPHYDPKSQRENPTWFMVDVQLNQRLEPMILLDQLRANRGLAKMELLRKGSRLSVQPVRASEFAAIETMIG